jgi:hypothetical protein
VLLAATASAGESFYFMAYFSQLGGLLPGYYMFRPGQGNATAAAAQMAQLKAGGMDGVVVITNSLDFFVGKRGKACADMHAPTCHYETAKMRHEFQVTRLMCMAGTK